MEIKSHVHKPTLILSKTADRCNCSVRQKLLGVQPHHAHFHRHSKPATYLPVQAAEPASSRDLTQSQMILLTVSFSQHLQHSAQL